MFILTSIAAVFFAACGAPADNKPANNPANNTNANTAKPVVSAPTKEALVALENKAFEAWKSGDSKFWDGFLADNYVGFAEGKRAGKADEIKSLTGTKCNIKSFALSDEKITSLGADAAILTAKSTADGTCADQKLPSPTISCTLYVRSGDAWKAAYHNETLIVDPKSPSPAAAKKADVKKDDAKPDALTDTLMVIEKAGWDAWKSRDPKKLEEVVGKEIAFVDVMGNFAATKADAIKAWTEPKCEIKSAGPSGGMATSISPVLAILTYRGDAEGTCDGAKLGPLWGTTFFLKEGEAWKPVYIFEAPA